MNLNDISKLRLINQQIAINSFSNPKELVNWMSAMQAQDLNMSLWAVGLRIKSSSIKQIEDEFNKGEIIRTHLMRPTWHLVSSDDIYWMLDLTAPRLINAMKFRDKQLGLTQEIFNKCNYLIERELSKEKFFTREQIAKKFESENIKTDENRLSHLLYHAELSGIICSGKLNNGKQTHALLSERIPNKKTKLKDEALAELAKRYFTSHGPATLKDFIWWSGLTATDAKKGLNEVEKNFESADFNSEKYLFLPINKNLKSTESLFLLPAYDEFIISYRDRSASIIQEHVKKTISNNGMFYPTVIENGVVTGIWKRTINKEKLVVEFKLFEPVNLKTRKQLEVKSHEFAKFLDKKIEVLFKN